MINKKALAGFEVGLMILSLFSFAFIFSDVEMVSAAAKISEPSVCCEKTTDGAWCVNADESECDAGFASSPTSCETTSYCRTGTCYESDEGICMENTPQNVCNENGGTWDARSIEEVPQCQLGCCIVADQAAFVSLVRCKKLSSLFGVENDYRSEITSEVACIATAQSQDTGACVYEKEFERICEFTTRGDCDAGNEVGIINGTNVSVSSQKTFYEDFLCSAEELNTACARQASTTCYKGSVYWVDSCGNRENVYSKDKVKSWNNGKIIDANQICSPNDGSNIDCGNCDYFLGTRCAEYDNFLGGPEFGDNYCQKTECVDRNGDKRINGESWCVYDEGIGNGGDSVGSRYYREVCADGEVIVEPCADFRNEVCIEGSVETSDGDFGTAACRVNRWQDCVLQNEEDDCTNIDRRDCIWVDSVTGMMIGAGEDSGSPTYSNPTASNTAFSNPTAAPITGQFIGGLLGGDEEEEEEEKTETNRPDGICIANYPPGLEFWEENSGQQICGQANARCIVVFEEGLFGGKKCVENCECLEEEWALDANRVCAGLGDCGGYKNYQGVYTDDGYKWIEDGKDKEFTPNTVNIISGGFTGMVVGAFMDSAGLAIDKMVKEHVSGGGIGTELETVGKMNIPSDGGSWFGNFFKSIGDSVKAGAKKYLESIKDEATKKASEEIAKKASEEAVAAARAKPGSSWISRQFGLEAGGSWDAVWSGVQWAAVAYMAGQLIGPMLGLSEDNTKALSMSLAAGFGTYKAVSVLKAGNAAGANPFLGFLGNVNPAVAGIGVGVVVFALMYKEQEVVIVEFNCMPWQAPTGGNICEECNDADLPCSEYRCRALGQNCELVNEGTDQEQCVNVNPQDVIPPVIKPNYAGLTSGHEYTNVKNSPPGPGFTIVNTASNDGCLKAFTPLEFGIEVDEPAQCKIDFNHTTSFEDMVAYIGGSNIFSYNHTEKFSLPTAAALRNSSFVIENGKDLTFYIRCKDKNGNENEAEYAVKLCVDPTPDTTAPVIEATSVTNGGCVAEDQNSAEVRFYTNEPAECRWSPQDQSFSNMQGTMNCNNQVYQSNAAQLFTCIATLSGIPRDSTDFYIRCKDYAGETENDRNEMAQSYKFSLRGSTGLKMKNLSPNSTIFGGVSPSPVELYVETYFGCNNGQAVCFYSQTGNTGDYIQFYDTNTEDGIHTQRLDLTGGEHNYYVKCVDEGGNLVEEVAEFTLDIDTNAPVVARIYEENNLLKIVTVRNSECSYTLDNCDFTFEEGTEMPYANSTIHVTEWKQDDTYYIKCRDEFRNEDADCSVIVRPTRDLFN
jgi:hypothetical protein